MEKYFFDNKTKYRKIILTTFLVGLVIGIVLFYGIYAYKVIIVNEKMPESLAWWHLFILLPIQVGTLFQIFPAIFLLVRYWYSSFVKFKPMILQVLFGFTIFFLFQFLMILAIIILIYLIIETMVSYIRKYFTL